MNWEGDEEELDEITIYRTADNNSLEGKPTSPRSD